MKTLGMMMHEALYGADLNVTKINYYYKDFPPNIKNGFIASAKKYYNKCTGKEFEHKLSFLTAVISNTCTLSKAIIDKDGKYGYKGIAELITSTEFSLDFQKRCKIVYNFSADSNVDDLPQFQSLITNIWKWRHVAGAKKPIVTYKNNTIKLEITIDFAQ